MAIDQLTSHDTLPNVMNQDLHIQLARARTDELTRTARRRLIANATRTVKEPPARSSQAATAPVKTRYWDLAWWYGAASVWRKPEEGS
jgi:hypothetical protein